MTVQMLCMFPSHEIKKYPHFLNVLVKNGFIAKMFRENFFEVLLFTKIEHALGPKRKKERCFLCPNERSGIKYYQSNHDFH